MAFQDMDMLLACINFCFLFIHAHKGTGIRLFLFMLVYLEEKQWHKGVKDYYFLTTEKHFLHNMLEL